MLTVEQVLAQVRTTVGVKPSTLALLAWIVKRYDIASPKPQDVVDFSTVLRNNADEFAGAIGANSDPSTDPTPGMLRSDADRASANADRAHTDSLRESKDAALAHRDAVTTSKKK